MKDVKYLTTDNEVKIAWNPYTLRILSTLNDGPKTVKQMADSLGEPHGKVHYHVQKLMSIDYLEIVKTETVRGITAKYYDRKYRLISISEEVSEEVYVPSVVRAIQSTFNRSVTQFRDSMNRSITKKTTKDTAKEVGDSAFQNVYLSDDDYTEFANYINDFVKKHSEPKEGTRTYGLLIAATIEE